MSSYWRGGSWTANHWDANNWLGPNAASGDVSVSLTGLRGTSAGGLLAPHTTVTITGLRADTAQGALSVGAGIEVALSGLAAITGAGAFLPALDIALLGQRVQTAIGRFRFARDDSGISVWATDRAGDLFVSVGADGLWAVLQPEANVSLEQQVRQYEAIFAPEIELWVTADPVTLLAFTKSDESSVVVEPVELAVQTEVPSMFVTVAPEDEVQLTVPDEGLVLN